MHTKNIIPSPWIIPLSALKNPRRAASSAASASLTHDISTRLTIEAAGGFLGGNYVTVGGGLYRASFDMDNRNMFGGLAGMSQGTQLVPLPDGMGFGMMQGFTGSMWQVTVLSVGLGYRF